MPAAQVSFSDRNESIVRRRRCCKHVKMYIFSSYSLESSPILINFDTKHPRVKRIRIYSIIWPSYFPTGNDNKIAKMLSRNLNISFHRPSVPISTKLGTSFLSKWALFSQIKLHLILKKEILISLNHRYCVIIDLRKCVY